MTRQEMIEQLITRNCRVIFKKANGEERDMVCTLQESVVPPSTATNQNRQVNDEVLPVWDVNAQGWRSFRIDSVISFS